MFHSATEIQMNKITPSCDYQTIYEVNLLNCRSLISRLETVDPRKMKHEEKLAFWVNVHNALVMHVIFLG